MPNREMRGVPTTTPPQTHTQYNNGEGGGSMKGGRGHAMGKESGTIGRGTIQRVLTYIGFARLRVSDSHPAPK